MKKEEKIPENNYFRVKESIGSRGETIYKIVTEDGHIIESSIYKAKIIYNCKKKNENFDRRCEEIREQKRLDAEYAKYKLREEKRLHITHDYVQKTKNLIRMVFHFDQDKFVYEIPYDTASAALIDGELLDMHREAARKLYESKKLHDLVG